MRAVSGLMVATVLLGGCATASGPPTTAPTATLHAVECLPPGMPALSMLVQSGGLPGLAREAETGQWIRGRTVLYARPGESTPNYLVYYVPTASGERIAAVDDHPGTPFPDWVDTGMVTESGDLRSDRHVTCQWARLVPREHI